MIIPHDIDTYVLLSFTMSVTATLPIDHKEYTSIFIADQIKDL